MFTKERFRLDLLEERFEIYKRTLEFCSIVQSHASLRANDRNKEQVEAALRAAHDSFRGFGFHRARALFGSDINDLFGKLNESYSYLVALGDETSPHYKATTFWEHVQFIAEQCTKLPDHFKPYVYFGDYRSG
jgi:hypothetical protein